MAALLGVAITRPYSYQGSLINPPVPATDFHLIDQYGQLTSLSSLTSGGAKAIFIFFGYTNCPDVCPTTLAKFKTIKERLGQRAQDVAFVYITVDPDRDTPESIRQYISLFDESFIGLTGEIDELEPIWKGYGVSVFRQDSGSAAGYLVDHSAYIYLVDGKGNLRLTYSFDNDTVVITEDVKHLLDE
jgi:protein SCO1/2